MRKRLRKFVDRRLQTTLIAALVISQLALVAACVWQLDVRLHEILDAETFRVHFDAPPRSDTYRSEALRLLALFATANLVLVFLIEILWKTYVGRLLTRYRVLLQRVQDLDFTPDGMKHVRHPLLTLALRWRRNERERLLGLRECLMQLEAARADPERQRTIFEQLASLLPEGALGEPPGNATTGIR